tara:strand:- start:14011 stop:14187 length:177 start_codon:yes stop_codon:yes gene_type:complete
MARTTYRTTAGIIAQTMYELMFGDRMAMIRELERRHKAKATPENWIAFYAHLFDQEFA